MKRIFCLMVMIICLCRCVTDEEFWGTPDGNLLNIYHLPFEL